ncbi:MAG TPA: DUF3467 domain-containing protein [Chitinispirillaceae bacterium]|nr:DUF3467 domain-containing protein [Chitinispirillaceae bacterium]
MSPDTSKKAAADNSNLINDMPSKIVWDDSNMRSVYANVTNVTGGREELIVLFGMNQAWQPSQKEVKVQLSDRVVLSPFAAKRLAILLGKTLTEYEKRFGVIDIGNTAS